MINAKISVIDDIAIKEYLTQIDENMSYADLFLSYSEDFEIQFDASLHRLYLRINGNNEIPIWNARIIDVINANNLNRTNIEFYAYLGGVGGGEALDAKLKIEIRQAEPQHLYTPHVHVSNDKGRHTVSIKIADGTILAGEKYWERFNKKDQKDLLKLIKDKREEFINFYNKQALQLLVPNPIKFTFRGKEHYLSYGKSENLSVIPDEYS